MNERRINSKCILCYKPVTTTSVEQTQNSNVSDKKFLLLLSRHLKLYSDCKPVSQVNVDYGNEFLCCEDCSKLGDSFSQLYFQLECLRLELNWKVTKIYQTMLLAGRVPSRLNAFRKQFEVSVPDNDQTFNEIEKLRKNLMKQSKRMLKSSPPNVSLKRMDPGGGDKRIKTEKLSPTKTSPPGCSASTFTPNKFELLAGLLTYVAVLHLSLPLLPSLIPIITEEESRIDQLDLIEENTATIENLTEEEESCRLSLADDHDDSICMEACDTSPDPENIPYSPPVSIDHSLQSPFQEEERLIFEANEAPARDDHNDTDENYTQHQIQEMKPSSNHQELSEETRPQNEPSSSKSVKTILSVFTIRHQSPSPEKEKSLLLPTRKSSRSLLNCEKCPKTFTNQASLDSHLKMHDEFENSQESDSDDDNSNHEDMDVDLEPDMDSTSSSDSENEMEIAESSNKHLNESIPIEMELKAAIKIEELPSNLVPNAEYFEPEIDIELQNRSCNQCPLICDSIELLEEHYDVSHPDPSTYTLICPISGCGSRFPTVRRLNLHLESHPKPKKLPPNQCELCQQIFSCETEVEKHRALHHNLDKYARCNSCGQMYPSRFRLRFHRLKKNPKLPRCFRPENQDDYIQFPIQKCIIGKIFCPKETCYEVFEFEESLNIHLKTHGDWNCTLCPKEFDKAHEFAWHELTEHNFKSIEPSLRKIRQRDKKHRKDLEEYKIHCTRCQYSFRERKAVITHFLQDHLEILKVPVGNGADKGEEDQQQYRRQCEICKKVFSPHASDNNVKNHLESVHNVEGMDPSAIAICPICKAPFTKRIHLTSHLRVEHKQTYTCKCPHCNKQFKSTVNFRQHLNKVHAGKNSGLVGAFECDVCAEKLSSKATLEKHKKFHLTNEKSDFKCEICDAVFPKKMMLYNHNQIHHCEPKRPLTCETCGKVFRDSTKLKQHKSYTHTDPSEWRFPCPEEGCGKRCWSRPKLRDHIRTHTKEKPFVCDLCGEAYSTRYSLRAHLAKKHGPAAANAVTTQPYTKPFDQVLREQQESVSSDSDEHQDTQTNDAEKNNI
ncbi:unnamed protein product [Orchesella dallaii]|uniref:C2H2-type domain-containing protein n=1 Tax=Orchesella dallaii TaxID=48710 RepID=A0ABP1S4N5_9HEXA